MRSRVPLGVSPALAFILLLICSAPTPLSGQVGGGPAPGTALHDWNTIVPLESPGVSIAVDVDGDGLDDIVGAGTLKVLLASPGEVFTESWSDDSQSYLSVAVGDFTGDGVIDLFGTYSSGALPPAPATLGALFIGDGLGSFTPGPPPGETHFRVIATDVDGDGTADLVTFPGLSSIEVRLSLGGGFFGAPVVSALSQPIPLSPRPEMFGDLNEDGIGDLVLGDTGGASVYYGAPDGTFTHVLGTPVGSFSDRVDAFFADMSGNGHLDVVVADTTYGRAAVLLGSGSGTLAAPIHAYPFDPNFDFGFRLADLDGDGLPEIITLDSAVNVLKRNAAGQYDLVQTLQVGFALTDAIIGDVHGDGIDDFILPRSSGFAVVPGYEGKLLLPEVQDPVDFPPAVFSSFFDKLDVDADGVDEFLYGRANLGPGGHQYTIYACEYSGSEGFTTIGASVEAQRVWPGQFVAGALPDLLRIQTDFTTSMTTYTVFAGDGSGGFTPSATTTLGVSQALHSPWVSDLNGDGFGDLWMWDFVPLGGYVIQVQLNDGTGSFGPVGEFPYAGIPSGAVDLDGDGIRDFFGRTDSFELVVMLGDGAGGWTTSQIVPLSAPGSNVNSVSFTEADFDQDGDLDLLMMSRALGETVGRFRWLRNDGGLTFTELGEATTPFDGVREILDIDADGDLDLVLENDHSFQFWTNEGGVWLPGEAGATGLDASRYAFTDVDGDGMVDLVGTNLSGIFLHPSDGDCDGDGVRDRVQVLAEFSPDCNGNLRPDDCDLASGFSVDLDGDGILDDCPDPFIRGDFNESGTVDIADAIGILLHVFGETADPTGCPPALDTNLDGGVDLADGIVVLQVLFAGSTLPGPFPTCGAGTPEDLLCDEFDCP